MGAAKEKNICIGCLTISSTYRLFECRHCQFNFCKECLLEHQHIDIYHRLNKYIQDIDTIVAGFVGYAHSQTEWVAHLTKDRLELQYFARLIQQTPLHYIITYLPNEVWLNHIDDLIEKNRFAIDEDCYWLPRGSKTQILKQETPKFTNKQINLISRIFNSP
jgi:hypothetical protein